LATGGGVHVAFDGVDPVEREHRALVGRPAASLGLAGRKRAKFELKPIFNTWRIGIGRK
jgi:hypothetical protein